MADSISAIPQQPFLGRLAEFLRFLEKDRPEFLPPQLGVMQGISKLALPQASTIENLSYGNQPFTMPPSGTGAMIPQVKTGRKPEVADLISMISGVPGGRAVADVGTKLSNEAADALVRAITGNPQATAPQVIRETSMPFMQAVAPRTPGLLEAPAKIVKPIPQYGLMHRPMAEEGGAARLHEANKSFGEDIYGPNALQYFGSGDPREANIIKILKSIKNNPEKEITIYRGVSKDAPKEINAGDWVTLDKSVAADYGDVVSKKVKVQDITTWPDALLEFGYFPK